MPFFSKLIWNKGEWRGYGHSLRKIYIQFQRNMLLFLISLFVWILKYAHLISNYYSLCCILDAISKGLLFYLFFLILKIHLGIACFSIFKCHLNLAIVMYPFINWKILLWVGLVKRMLQRWSPKLWDLKGNRILSFAHPAPFSSHATTWNSTIDIALLWTTVHVCTNSVV